MQAGVPQSVGGDRGPCRLGGREFLYPTTMLEVDDVIWHDNQRWRVLSVSVDGDGSPAVVIVEPEASSLSDKLSSEKGAIRLLSVTE